MSAVADPLVSAPAPVVAPAPAAPAAPVATPNLVTEHTRTDKIQNQIAAKLAAARPPMPGQPAPLASPLAPPLAAAAPAPIVPGALPVIDPAAPAIIPAAAPTSDELDLTQLDFDAPPKPDTPVVLPDAVATPATTPEIDVVRELAETLARGDVPEKVEEVFLKTPRGRQMITAFKALRDLAQSPDKGGIGRVPTMDEIKEADASHRNVTAMTFEYANDPLSFATNLLVPNPETGRTFLGDPAQATKVLESIPQALLRAAQTTQNPVYAQMLTSYSIPAFELFFNHQYTGAFQMPEESPAEIAQYRAANQQPPLLNDKIRMLDALQLSEFKAFGKARPLNWQPGQPAASTPSGPDPEKLQLMDRLRQADAQIANNQRQQLNNVVTTIETSGKTAAMGDIDQALKFVGVDKVYPSSVIRSQQNDIYEELKSALPMHDPSGWQRYQIQLQQAARGQATPDTAAKTFRQLFQNALRHSPQVRERLNDLVKGGKSHVDAQHQSRVQSQLRTEPNGAGIPAPSSVLPGQQLARQQGESIEDFNTRRILAASQRAAQQPTR